MKRTLAFVSVLAGAAVPMSFSWAADEAAAVADAGQLQEVVVTAQRRAENVQKASVEIEVLDAAALQGAGVTHAQDLENIDPSLTFANSGQNFSTYLRGVGSFDTDASSDSSIAYNINGVFISRPDGVGDIFFDLDRVEVLKGPQGTLYGRNASGGAINLITTQPTFTEAGYATVDVGNYGLIHTVIADGGPITDTLAVRAAFQYTKHDGYLTDGYDDQNDQSARLSALWKPSDIFQALIVAEFNHEGGAGSAGAFRSDLRSQPADPWTGPSLAPQPETAALGGSTIDNDGFVHSNISALNATLTWNLGFADLTFIPAVRETRPDTLTYQPGFYFYTAETSTQQSYELRLSHDDNLVDWVGGIYYFDEQQTQNYVLQAIPIQDVNVVTDLNTKSDAAFGEAHWHLTDTLRLIGGLRYSEDKKGQDGTNFNILPTVSTVDDYGRRVDTNVSYKGGVEYDLAPENMLYATVATGYKAGGFFPGVPAPDNTYKPETLKAYTLGSRNRFLDNRIQFNAEVFYWDYDNKQERFLGELPTGGTGLLTTNAGKATIYGTSLDMIARTGPGTVHATLEYTHSKYDDFSYDVVNAGPFGYLGYSTYATSCALGPVGPVTAVGTQQSVNCAGKPLPHAPTWAGTLGYDYPLQIGNGDTLTPGVNVQVSSSMYLSPDFITSAQQGGYAWFDSDLAYQHRQWTATAWIHNIGDKAVYTGGYRYPFSISEKAPPPVAGDPSTFYADIRPPRTFGVTLKMTF